jgi:purine-binding chemotaxis protein CheW
MQLGTSNAKGRNGQPGLAPDTRNVVTFRLERQLYALPIEPIQQIIEMVTVTPIPQVNHSVEGVINYHGAAVPVVNLRRHLGRPAANLRVNTHIILVQVGAQLVGLIVDEVLDVLNLTASQIISPSQILPASLGQATLLQGLVQTPAGTVLLLNLSNLFQPGQLAPLPELGAQALSLAEGAPAAALQTVPIEAAL